MYLQLELYKLLKLILFIYFYERAQQLRGYCILICLTRIIQEK